MKDLPEIPSEFIEPYLKRFLMIQIESVGSGFDSPEKARQTLKGVDYFISCFGGLHSRIATSNEYDRFIKLSDEEMISICKKVASHDTR